MEEYPYISNPALIDSLTPDQVYKKGGDYFFYWIEHKLKKLGHIAVGSAAYLESARDHIDEFKALLKVVVDPRKSIQEKVDAGWSNIRWFGGDEHIAKKIIFLFNPEKTLPIFSTNHLECFCGKLSIDFGSAAIRKYGKSYDQLTLGQQYELLIDLILSKKNVLAPTWNNLEFSQFLYIDDVMQPKQAQFASMSSVSVRASKPSPMHPLGLLFEPSYEQEVVYLFSVLHRELGFPYILKLGESFPDATVLDNEKKERKIEFELYSSSFVSHGHDPKLADWIVCWENDLTDDNVRAIQNFPKIISVKDFIQEKS